MYNGRINRLSERVTNRSFEPMELIEIFAFTTSLIRYAVAIIQTGKSILYASGLYHEAGIVKRVMAAPDLLNNKGEMPMSDFD